MSSAEMRRQRRQRLEDMTGWAKRIRSDLGPLMRAHGDRVHFRAASTGVAMVGLLPDRPQRGKGGFRALGRVADDFESLFEKHCVKVDHGRVTGEKALQSFLIRDAQTHGGHISALNDASSATGDPVDLVFVTDEISLPTDRGKVVCDVLALRIDGGRSTPVLLEPKDSRQMTRLIAQLEAFAPIIDEHAHQFAALYSALLDRTVTFDGPAEKWIVWPMAGAEADPREAELPKLGIRVVGYAEQGGLYRFRVGCEP